MSSPTISLPLTDLEKKARNHGLISSIAFLIFLPLGVLVARHVRTFSNGWWFAHWITNFIISGPLIFAGWALGHQTTSQSFTGGHFKDRHQKIGLALLILYLVQLFMGAFIHFVRTPSIFVVHRPPQNYLHAILGIAILALAAYQVHYGLYTEWAFVTGNLHPVPMSAKHAWLALIIIFWALYGLGLAFLPRQYKQEKEGLLLQQDKKETEGRTA
ncbi:hypothetical protein DENSPDRAFT_838654 [Dentipellis sp. KUC8613]|nr:hypothetical protein DENSPDRAFT_838654 [Dentipellis sp. KUC8613]